MDLQTIEQAIYDSLGMTGNPQQPDLKRIRARINQVQREVISRKGIGPKLRRKVLTMLTGATSPFGVLPQAATHVYHVMDRTNNIPLTYMPLGDIRYNDPGNLATGNPYAYDILNFNANTAKDPSAAGQLTAVSDSASDNSDKSVFVEVVRTSGYFQAGTIALNGTTPVSVGPTDSLQVVKFYIALATGGETTAAGNILLKDGAGNEIARIPPTRRYPRYTQLIFFPVPSSALTLTVDVDIHIEDMSQASDEPIIIEDFHDVIEQGVLRYEYRKKEKMGLAKDAGNMFDRRIAELRSYLNRPTGIVLDSDRQRRVSFSALGPNFPPGS